MNRFLTIILIFALSSFFVACDQKNAKQPVDNGMAASFNFPSIQAFKPQGKFDEDNVKALAKSHDAFGLKLYAKIAKEHEGNIFCSPVSIATALSLTYAGAQNNTRAQLRKALEYSLEDQELFGTYGHFQKQLMSATEGVEINIVNGLFAQHDYPWSANFENKISQNFPTQLFRVDYATQHDVERKKINFWVQQNTKDRIKDLLAPRDVDGSTVNVLVNAITFDGDWKKSFDPQNTKERDFTVSEKKTVKVKMMEAKEKFYYAENQDIKMVAVPYKNEAADLIIILPQKDVSLSDVEQKLVADYSRWYQSMDDHGKIKLRLPKIDMTFRRDLKADLEALGIVDAWSRSNADFKAMLDMEKMAELKAKNPQHYDDRVHFSKVIHKAFIKWDEVGTEAAAATAVVMSRGISRDPLVYCDKPFLFVIADFNTGSILFMGRVMDPSVK